MALPTYAAQTVYEAQIAEVDCLKARHKTAESEAHNLFASLQHRAFRGEL